MEAPSPLVLNMLANLNFSLNFVPTKLTNWPWIISLLHYYLLHYYLASMQAPFHSGLISNTRSCSSYLLGHKPFIIIGIQGVMESAKISTLKLQKELELLNIVPANNSHTKVSWGHSITPSLPPSLPLVAHPMIIGTTFSPEQPAEGQELVIECMWEGTPTPAIEWMKDNRPLVGSDEDCIFTSVSVDTGVARIRIERATENYNGHYTCIASNVAGSDSSTIFIREIGKWL